MNPDRTPCVACRSSSLSRFGSRENYTYYRCKECGTLQLVPMPGLDSMEEAYQDQYSVAGHCQTNPELRNREAKPQFDALCNALARHAATGLVLDYGAGWGGLLEMLRNRGMAAEGAELSVSMADYCESRGYSVKRGDLAQIEGRARYNAIVLSSVFEHLLYHERWIHDARRLLKPAGVVISLQPTAGFATLGGMVARFSLKTRELPHMHQVFWPPWHTVLFSLKGMRLLFERSGFELVEVQPAPLQRQKGLVGVAQRILSTVNALATPVFGNGWPLHVGHVFVFRKNSN